MNVEMIRNIHGYNAWATERVLECCDDLTDDQFTQEDETPWGSIRNQFVHQFIVHQRWLNWADGSMSGEAAYALRADPDDYPDIESVRTYWNVVNTQNGAFLARLTPEILNRDLSVDFPGTTFSIATGEIMVHIAMHSMQHRSETAMALTRQGHSPGDIDYIFHVMSRS